jgi:hypothetical protein
VSARGKAVRALLLLAALACAGPAPARQRAPRSVADYFAQLPARYVTHEGDYGRLERTVDERAGYLAVAVAAARPARPVFELALYRAAGGAPFFVAANTKYDHACHSFETFFLTHDGKDWADAARRVMPPLTPSMFYGGAPAALVGKHEGWRSYLRHRPARRGLALTVTLELCDVAVENDPALSATERARLLALLGREPPSIVLHWNRKAARFEPARGAKAKGD